MFRYLQSFRAAYHTGKLHRKLIVRVMLLGTITFIGILATLYDVCFLNLFLWPVILSVMVGFAFGFYIMSRVYAVRWHEHEETLTISALDVAGVIIFILYYAIRFAAETYFARRYGDAFRISGLALSFFWGIMLGRLCGIFRKVHYLFRAQ